MDFAFIAASLAALYFLILRPQQQEKATRELMLASLAKDDTIVTTGGIHGKITEVAGKTLVVELAERVKVTIDRDAVARKEAGAAGNG